MLSYFVKCYIVKHLHFKALVDIRSILISASYKSAHPNRSTVDFVYSLLKKVDLIKNNKELQCKKYEFRCGSILSSFALFMFALDAQGV